ncbi:GyrI-like domain-containing protein [Planococcus sp. YIM B11945]|uniref:GyrI-like domain-containing protein n=1 Tax=Planococcus sp. YIM B11945 TaxID=3435410 RepID=UPI003D7D27A9
MKRHITEPVVEMRPEQPYAGIAIQATLAEWGKVNELIEEIFKWLVAKELEPAGALFYRYWIIGNEEEQFHVEVGVPIERMIVGDERVIASSLPGGAYVTALHHGHPDGLDQSFAELEKWAQKEGLELDKRYEGETEIWNGRFECYLSDPSIEPDLNRWEIQLSFLLMPDDAA